MAAGCERDRARARCRRLPLVRRAAPRNPRRLRPRGPGTGSERTARGARRADRPAGRHTAGARARRVCPGDVRRARPRRPLGHGGPPPPAAPARRPHLARLLGRDDRRADPGGARRDRRCPPRGVRETPSTATATRSSTTSTPAPSTRSRATGCARRGSGSATGSCATVRARPSSSSTASRRPSPSCRPTPASARSSAGSPTGSTAASSAAPAPPGCSASASTSAPTTSPRARRRRAAEQSSSVVLELWLQAADDPTLALPTSLLHDGGDAVFGFLRSADPRVAVHRQLGLIEPVLAEGGLAFDAAEPTRIELSDDDVRFVLRTAIPRFEELGVPVLLPRNWVNSSSRLRVNLTATSVARAIERPAHDRCTRPVRLEARDRRHDAHRGGADRARGGEGAADPRPRALARTAALRGGEGAAVPRAPPRGLGGRPRPRGLGHRARGRRARARRRRPRRRAQRAARRRRRAALRAARRRLRR